MIIDPRRLLVLSAVNQHGSVTGAASALHMSPSAVSQQLAALERETGLVLIDRSRRGGQRPIEFTSAGRRLSVHAESMIHALDEAEAELLALTESVTGTVTIAAFFTVLRGFGGRALLDLAHAYPGLHLQIDQADERLAIADVQAGRVDLALVEDDEHRQRILPRGLHYEALADDPFRVTVPRSWPQFEELSALADRPWVDGPPDTAVGQAMQRVRRTTGLAFPSEHRCVDFTAGLTLVAAGLAAAFIPQLAISALAPVDVRVLALPGLGARRIGIVYRRARNEPTPAVRAVIEALRTAALDIS